MAEKKINFAEETLAYSLSATILTCTLLLFCMFNHVCCKITKNFACNVYNAISPYLKTPILGVYTERVRVIMLSIAKTALACGFYFHILVI